MVRSLHLALGTSLLLLAAACGADAKTAAVVFRVHVPATTPEGDTVYLAGNLNGWDPASAPHALAQVASLTHELTLSLPFGTHLEFKFTRGSWQTAEKGAGGEELPNRSRDVSGPLVLDLTVESWADQAP